MTGRLDSSINLSVTSLTTLDNPSDQVGCLDKLGSSKVAQVFLENVQGIDSPNIQVSDAHSARRVLLDEGASLYISNPIDFNSDIDSESKEPDSAVIDSDVIFDSEPLILEQVEKQRVSIDNTPSSPSESVAVVDDVDVNFELEQPMSGEFDKKSTALDISPPKAASTPSKPTKTEAAKIEADIIRDVGNGMRPLFIERNNKAKLLQGNLSTSYSLMMLGDPDLDLTNVVIGGAIDKYGLIHLPKDIDKALKAQPHIPVLIAGAAHSYSDKTKFGSILSDTDVGRWNAATHKAFGEYQARAAEAAEKVKSGQLPATHKIATPFQSPLKKQLPDKFLQGTLHRLILEVRLAGARMIEDAVLRDQNFRRKMEGIFQESIAKFFDIQQQAIEKQGEVAVIHNDVVLQTELSALQGRIDSLRTRTRPQG